MPKKTSYFTIGLFVSLGVLITAVVIVWLSASQYFAEGRTYITYFDESVQGLQIDSPVKYRGVEVGNVKKIRVAPDNRLIGVVMKISLRGDVEQETVATLRPSGITGIVFIELDRKKPGEVDVSPRVEFGAEYPIISSRPSGIRKIVAGIDKVIGKVGKIDFEGISTDLKETIKAVEVFLHGQQMNNIIANVESSTAKMDRLMERLENNPSDIIFSSPPPSRRKE